MKEDMREVARHGMKKDGSITRLVRRTVGTDAMASELGARLAGEIEARLAGIDHRLHEAMEARFEALAHRLEEAVQRTVGTEVHRNAAHLDGQIAARTEEGAQRLEGTLRAGLAEEVHRGAAHLDARVTELVHLRSEEVAGHLAGMLRTAVAEDVHQGMAYLDGQLAARGDATAHRLEDALTRAVAGEVHRGAAHLDARVTELVHLRSEEVAGHLAGMLRTAVAEDVHQGMAYLDGQLAARGDAAAHRLEDALTRAVAGEVHRNVNHLHEHLAGDLSRHLDERTGALHAQLIETLAADRAALMAALHDGMSHVDRHLSAHLSKEVALLLGAGGAGAEGGEPRVVQERLVTLGRLLEPCAARGVAKRRVGHAADGGYVMLDDLGPVRFALSFGVGDEMTWDLEMAGRGIEVHQFDYTIEAPPEAHELIRFHRSRIAPVAEGSDHSLASAQALGGGRPCIVKMDIEGDEWVVLDAAGEGDFERVTQLVLEFHDFDRVADDAWFERAERVLRRLAASFAVVHVHANNYGALHSRGNVAFPELLEVTFANRGRYDFEPSAEIFPTPLDAPNRGDLPDIRLGSFRF